VKDIGFVSKGTGHQIWILRIGFIGILFHQDTDSLDIGSGYGRGIGIKKGTDQIRVRILNSFENWTYLKQRYKDATAAAPKK
jgi:hypothetical protein